MLLRIRDGLQRRKWLAWFALAPIALIFMFWGGSNSLDFNGVVAPGRRDRRRRGDPGQQGHQGLERHPGALVTAVRHRNPGRTARAHPGQHPRSARARAAAGEPARRRELPRQRSARAHRDPEHSSRSRARMASTIPRIARQLLQSNGISELEFFNEQRKQMLLNQLQAGIGNSYFLTKAEAQRLSNLENEEREVEYAQFKAEQFAGTDPIDDAAIKAYYDKNGDRFMTTESVSLEYAELRLEQLASQVAPTEADLRKLYDDSRANYVLDERRRARHILIPVNGDDDAAARKQAESVLAEARAGKDFAELAKKYSKDSTSARRRRARLRAEEGLSRSVRRLAVRNEGRRHRRPGEVAVRLSPHQARGNSGGRGQAVRDSARRARFAIPAGPVGRAVRRAPGTDRGAAREGRERSRQDRAEPESHARLDRRIPARRRRRAAGLERRAAAGGVRRCHAEPGQNRRSGGAGRGPAGAGQGRPRITRREVKPLDQVRGEIVALLTHDRGVAAAKAAAEAPGQEARSRREARPLPRPGSR